MMEKLSDIYLEMFELADEMREVMNELKGVCEERDLDLELKHIGFYVDAIWDALSEMEYPLMDMENALGGGEE